MRITGERATTQYPETRLCLRRRRRLRMLSGLAISSKRMTRRATGVTIPGMTIPATINNGQIEGDNRTEIVFR
jgi:hypothetical protein